jgi:hypothetical protein
VFTGGSMYFYVAKTRFYPVDLFLPVRAWVLYRPWLSGILSAGFAVITLVEILSPFCLLSRTFRRIWLVSMLAFHVLTLLLMQIFFWENVVLILVLMTGLLVRRRGDARRSVLLEESAARPGPGGL